MMADVLIGPRRMGERCLDVHSGGAPDAAPIDSSTEEPFTTISQPSSGLAFQVFGSAASVLQHRISKETGTITFFTRSCAVCGKTEECEKFKGCAKCMDLKLSQYPRYCSQICQREDWRRQHKAFHKAHDAQILRVERACKVGDDDQNREAAVSLARSSDRYQQLVGCAGLANCDGDYRRATKLAHQALELDADGAMASISLGWANHLSSKYALAATAFTRAMVSLECCASDKDCESLSPAEHDELWARAACMAFTACKQVNHTQLNHMQGSPVDDDQYPKVPEWMADDIEAKRIANRVVALIGDHDVNARQMRGSLIYNCPTSTISELCQAMSDFEKCSELTPDAAVSRQYLLYKTYARWRVVTICAVGGLIFSASLAACAAVYHFMDEDMGLTAVGVAGVLLGYPLVKDVFDCMCASRGLE